jgi:hypothetical protein
MPRPQPSPFRRGRLLSGCSPLRSGEGHGGPCRLLRSERVTAGPCRLRMEGREAPPRDPTEAVCEAGAFANPALTLLCLGSRRALLRLPEAAREKIVMPHPGGHPEGCCHGGTGRRDHISSRCSWSPMTAATASQSIHSTQVGYPATIRQGPPGHARPLDHSNVALSRNPQVVKTAGDGGDTSNRRGHRAPS